MRLDRCMRLLPHDHDGGGFFIAVFEKVSEHDEDAGALPAGLCATRRMCIHTGPFTPASASPSPRWSLCTTTTPAPCPLRYTTTRLPDYPTKLRPLPYWTGGCSHSCPFTPHLLCRTTGEPEVCVVEGAADPLRGLFDDPAGGRGEPGGGGVPGGEGGGEGDGEARIGEALAPASTLPDAQAYAHTDESPTDAPGNAPTNAPIEAPTDAPTDAIPDCLPFVKPLHAWGGGATPAALEAAARSGFSPLFDPPQALCDELRWQH